MADHHQVVSHDQWLDARRSLLAREKQFTRVREELSQERRELPWEAVSKDYVFEGLDGKQSLLELFDGRSQLIVYHFMFGPDWDAGCKHYSFWADSFNEVVVHLNQRDVTMIAVSHAPYSKLAAYQERMGWSFKWVSSHGADFNFDYQASFTPGEIARKKALYNFVVQDPGISEHAGISVFCKDEAERLFHTYSTYARGIDITNTAYNYLDLAPKGRDEQGRGQYWVRRHDEYAPGHATDTIDTSLLPREI